MVSAKQRLSACATPLPKVPEEVRDACTKLSSPISFARRLFRPFTSL